MHSWIEYGYTNILIREISNKFFGRNFRSGDAKEDVIDPLGIDITLLGIDPG